MMQRNIWIKVIMGFALAGLGASVSLNVSFYCSKMVFLRSISAVYCVAFWSWVSQCKGIVDRWGVMPLGHTIHEYESWTQGILKRGISWTARYITIPLKRYLLDNLKGPQNNLRESSTNVELLLNVCMCALFVALSGCLLSPSPWKLVVCYVVYLLVKTIGGPFYSFQWDLLLLESGFISIFLSLSNSDGISERLLMLALQLVWFRLVFGSGWVKVTSGCPKWNTLTATEYHFFTQPLPRPLAVTMHHLPPWVHRLFAFSTIYGELILPFAALLPACRLVCVAAFQLLQVSISLTGNYGFFNLLAAGLTMTLLSDDEWHTLTGYELATGHGGSGIAWWWTREVCICAVGAASVITSTVALFGLFDRAAPRFPGMDNTSSESEEVKSAQNVHEKVCDVNEGGKDQTIKSYVASIVAVPQRVHEEMRSFYCGAEYGLFARMTTSRPELKLFIQGPNSNDEWLPLEFLSKPGAPEGGCKSVWPPLSLPRLDWRMWFQALAAQRKVPPPRWFLNLLAGVLEGSAVLSLLDASAEAVRRRCLDDRTSSVDDLSIKVELELYTFGKASKTSDPTWIVEYVRPYIEPTNLQSLVSTLHAMDVQEAASRRKVERNTAASVLQGFAARLGAVKRREKMGKEE